MDGPILPDHQHHPKSLPLERGLKVGSENSSQKRSAFSCLLHLERSQHSDLRLWQDRFRAGGQGNNQAETGQVQAIRAGQGFFSGRIPSRFTCQLVLDNTSGTWQSLGPSSALSDLEKHDRYALCPSVRMLSSLQPVAQGSWHHASGTLQPPGHASQRVPVHFAFQVTKNLMLVLSLFLSYRLFVTHCCCLIFLTFLTQQYISTNKI